jgi:hypothetical protein
LAADLSNPLPERVTRRIHVALPIRVTYWDSASKPFLEMACTYDISESGARVTGLRNVKAAGEIIAIERGRNKAFCRVVWIGEPNSELDGQIGIQCVESDRTMWEAELREMQEIYDPIVRESSLRRPHLSVSSANQNRRRHERFDIEGLAELLRYGPDSSRGEAVLRNLSELGCLISTQQALPLGTEVKLVLNVDSYDLSVKGQIRHVDPQLGLGVEFQEIRKGDRQILRFLLRKLAEQQLEEGFDLELLQR